MTLKLHERYSIVHCVQASVTHDVAHACAPNLHPTHALMHGMQTGESIKKPIYNHVNSTLDEPEEVKPTPIVIIDGLHPFVDERVRNLLDFTIYLVISDEI